MQTKSISYKNTNAFYRITGNGQPIVLLHGFAEDGTLWQQQVDFLKENFTLIIPDVPGSGLSPFNNQLTTIDDYADVVKAILDNEKISSCIIIGHSMGGYIILALAEKYPQLLKAFSLFHSTAFPDSEEKKQIRLKAIDFINTNGAYSFIKTSIPNLFYTPFKTNHSEQVETLIEQGKNFTNEALVQYYNAMIARPDRTSVLKNSTIPIQFIIGQHDTAIPFQSSLQQCHLPSQSDINILANTGHMGMFEETEKANEILLRFLNRVD